MSMRLSVEEKIALLRRREEDGVSWVRLAEHTGVPLRTLERWSAAWRADPSSASLRRAPRRDRGTKRLPADLCEAIEALALQSPPPSVAFVHRRIADLARDRGLAPPSYTTVRQVVAGIDPGLRILAHDGDAAYRDRFELVYRRTAARPNEQWQADHTLLDIMVLDPSGQPARPWLTVLLDDHSRAAAGYTVFLGDPTAEQTALAFHQAVTPKTNLGWPVQGLPDVLYSDHGSDFTSTRLDQVCLDTHVQLIHSRPGRPQGRGKIERFYRTITSELLPHLPGFIPHGTRGRPTTPPALTLEHLDTALDRFIVEEYNHRTHSETGQAPVEAWKADGWIPRMPAHPEDIDLLLLTAATSRKVQRDGIQFAATRYVSTTLAAYVGESVTIRYNPRDMGEVKVWHDNQYLCRAIAPELAAEQISYKQLQAARTARRRELKQQLHARRSLADALPGDARYTNAASPSLETVKVADHEPPAVRHGLRTYVND